MKDFIRILPEQSQPHPTWLDTLTTREDALQNRHMRAAECWSEHTRHLSPLVVGDHIQIQNQTGPHLIKWDKTGKVLEVCQFDQYAICVDGLVVKVLDSQFRGPVFKTGGWLQGQLSLPSF